MPPDIWIFQRLDLVLKGELLKKRVLIAEEIGKGCILRKRPVDFFTPSWIEQQLARVIKWDCIYPLITNLNFLFVCSFDLIISRIG